MLKIRLAIFTVLFSMVSIFAQAPEKMSYQAVVRNSENAIVANQIVAMQISILEGSVPYFAQDSLNFFVDYYFNPFT